MSVEGTIDEIVLRLARDRWLAHQFLFPHRRSEESAPVHHALVNSIYSPGPRQLIEGFRGVSKSTHLEEAAVIKGCYREFHNMVILGASYERACERLASIKREYEQNDALREVFGNLKGTTWQEGKIVLSTGICIQALGRDQSMDGIKHFDHRPDAALVDDVENAEEVRTDLERQRTWVWFIRTFLPALDHPLHSWVRVLGTRRGTGSLPERLENAGWPTAKYPIEYLDERGRRTAAWPGKFPLATVDQMKRTYRGDMHTWAQEYMCTATSEADRVFSRSMFRVEPIERSWHAVYAMIDPARTVNQKSAATGYAVWSWINNRLRVWAAGAQLMLPDEIIDLIFTINDEFGPVEIGVEEDGLNEWIKQPLRHEAAKRRVMVPIKPMRAPRGKLDFIKGLQPFAAAGEMIFNATLPELEEQFLSFPSGRIDAPNALAYALPMRPAAPIYEGVRVEELIDDLYPDAARPLYLAAHAVGSLVTAVLCQHLAGKLLIYADWAEEGAPLDVVGRIMAEAGLEADATPHAPARSYDWREALKLPENRPVLRRLPLRWVVPPSHGDPWNNVGLEQAIRHIPATVTRGTAVLSGREALGRALTGSAGIAVSERARWTLRALAGGYTRMVRKGGALSEEAEPGIYRTLMEGLESFAGIAAVSAGEDDDDNAQPLAYNRHGMAYRSALPAGGYARRS